MADARFEDGDEKPLRLKAETADDLTVLAALAQDAVMQTGDIAWLRKKRRVAILINRFRWEDRADAEAVDRPLERVRSMLVIEGVDGMQSAGLNPAEKDVVLSLLSLSFEPDEAPSGTVTATFSGDGALRMQVEYLDLRLMDVSQPYASISQSVPRHPVETD